MVVKTINYVDFDNNERTDVFHFNLTSAEIAEIQMDFPEGIVERLEFVMKSRNNSEIGRFFRYFLEKSVGRKSPDGKKIVKNDEIRSDFFDSNAYSVFLTEMVEKPQEAKAFFTAILPSDTANNKAATTVQPIR